MKASIKNDMGAFGVIGCMGGMKMYAETAEIATFAGGCFWCMEPIFDHVNGVNKTRVGYTGGQTKAPTYEEVCTGKTGHAEAIEIHFNPKIVSYDELLTLFWRNIDPTAANQQFADHGPQYRTAIFYHSDQQKKRAEESKSKLNQFKKFPSPIMTEIARATRFYSAEDYHQKYYEKNVLHYNFYKVGSGREAYLKRLWGDTSKIDY